MNAVWSKRTRKYEQASRHHLEVRLHVCLNRHRDFFAINCAALHSTLQKHPRGCSLLCRNSTDNLFMTEAALSCREQIELGSSPFNLRASDFPQNAIKNI